MHESYPCPPDVQKLFLPPFLPPTHRLKIGVIAAQPDLGERRFRVVNGLNVSEAITQLRHQFRVCVFDCA